MSLYFASELAKILKAVISRSAGDVYSAEDRGLKRSLGTPAMRAFASSSYRPPEMQAIAPLFLNSICWPVVLRDSMSVIDALPFAMRSVI